MKKYLKIIIIIFIIIFLALGVPLIINLLFKHNSNIEILRSEWTAGDALAFYGSILGSSITLIGIWYTIKNERKKQLDENSIMYKPIIELIQCNKKVDYMTLKREMFIIFGILANNKKDETKFFNQQQEDVNVTRLIFKNKGRGETFNLTIDDLNLTSNWEQDGNNLQSGVSGLYIGEVLQENEFVIDILFPKHIFLPKKNIKNKEFILQCILKISYSDMFNKQRYQNIIYFNMRIEKNGSIVSDAPNSQNEKLGYYAVFYTPSDFYQEKYIYSKNKKKFIHEFEYVNEKGC